jgi:uncharacterized protein YhaN
VTVNALRFKKLEIDRLAGIPRGSGFTIENLSKDINLIHGPNGSGKSLIGQSLLALVWPVATTLERPTVTGTWTVGDSDWSVELDAGHPMWRCDGVVSEPPSLPPAESRAHHWLGLRELLSDDGPDAAATNKFAERIACELLGGFDLDGAARSLGLTPRPPQRRKLRGDFDETQSELGEARSNERELHAKSATLETLSTQCDAAREAEVRHRRLDRALEHRDASDDVLRLKAELGQFDGGLDQLVGNEQERLNDFRKRLRDAERDLTTAEQDLKVAERAKSETRFTNGVVPNEMLEAAGQDVSVILEAHRESRQTAASLEEATSQLNNRAERVASTVSDETLESMGVTPSDEMAKYARDLVAHREHVARVEAREREVAETEKRLNAEAESLGTMSADQVHRGLDVLSRWLGSPPRSIAPKPGWLVTLLIAAGVIAVLFLILAMLHHWAWGVGLVPAIAFVWLARPAPAMSSEPDNRAAYQREYEATRQPQPASWTVDAVQPVWIDLTETWVKFKGQESARQRLDQEQVGITELRREVDSTEQEMQHTRSKLEAALTFGIDDTRADWLLVLGTHLSDWQTVKVQVHGLSAKLDEHRKATKQALVSFGSRIEPYAEGAAQEATEAAGMLEDLKKRAQEYREEQIKADSAERDRQRAESEIEQTSAQVDTLLADLGLDTDREGVLRQWLEELDQYREVKRQLGEAQVRQKTIAAEVGEGHPALAQDRSRIETDRDAAQREAKLLSDLEQEIGAIRGEVENAKLGHRVEDAQRRVDEARDALANDLREAEQKVAGHAVVEWLREESTDRTQPAVLRYASALFQRITHGRYELRVDESSDGPTFVAWDTQHEMQKSLDQLSAGERVQLLVAVRLGFLEHEESGVRLPLILDEILGTTDDERASAVIDMVVEICRSDRQVFYFTAQPDEVGKWLGRLQGVEDIDLKQVDLARLSGLAEADGVPLVIERPAEAQLPDPSGLSHEDYGWALGVPGLDPNRPVGTVHLWHLIDEPILLHALLKKYIRCWGPFESLVVKRVVQLEGLEDDRIRVIVARARAIKAAFAAWRVGRGRSVDRAALEASSAVSGSFIEWLTELTASVDGDARRLINALDASQVTRWRSASTDTLREYLEEQGYLDQGQRLTREELCHRALGDSARAHVGVELGEGWLARVVAGLPEEHGRTETGAVE